MNAHMVNCILALVASKDHCFGIGISSKPLQLMKVTPSNESDANSNQG